MSFRLLLIFLFIFATGCSNVIRSGLMNDGSIMLPPSAERTLYVQLRNTSENQSATPTNISARLGSKGYTLVPDPERAAYWLQAQVVYCHKGAENMTPEMIVKSGFGAGIGSGGAPLPTLGSTGFDMAGMAAAFGGNPMVNLPEMNAMMRRAMAGRGGAAFGMGGMGMAAPPKPEGTLYICIADVLVTEKNQDRNLPPKVYTKRSVAHVLQKEPNIEEATPIIREKLAAGLVGPF